MADHEYEHKEYEHKHDHEQGHKHEYEREYEHERDCDVSDDCEEDECEREQKCECEHECKCEHKHEHECKPKHECEGKGVIYVSERYLYSILRHALMLPESYCIEHITSAPFSGMLGIAVESADIPVSEDGKPQQVRPIYGRHGKDGNPCLLRIEFGSSDKA